jgi:anti-sigma factor RsiW
MSGRPITEDDLNGFVDLRLDPGRHAEVSAYLEAHPEIAERIKGFVGQRDLLRRVLLPIGDEPVPPELNVTHIIEATRRPSRSPWLAAAAAAAVVLLGLGGTGGWTLRGISDPPLNGVASLGQEAVQNYAVYVPDHAHPVELRAADTAELVNWASERLGRAITVPDLQASGYRFMGGRVVATPHGPAALFMYDNDHGARLVMLARKMAIDRDTRMQPLSDGGVNGFAWAARGMGYSLVGPTDPQRLHPIADEARRQIAS